MLHALNLPTIPSPTTPRRFDCLAWCHSRTYRHSDRSRLAAPVRQGIAGVSWASPWYGRLATTTGRIEFVILRTGLSPPDALHTPSRECSSDRLRGSSRTPTGTRTLLLQVTRNRTIPIARAPGFLKASDAMRFDPQCFPTGSPKRERGESAVKNRDHAAVFTGIGGRPSRHKIASDRSGYDALMPVSHPEMAEEPLTCLSFAPDRKEFLHVLVLRSSVIKTGWKNIDSQPG